MSLNPFRRRSQSEPLGLVIDNHPREDHKETKYLIAIADGSVHSAIRQEFDERHVSKECINFILTATVEGMRRFPKETAPHLHLTD